MMKSAVGPQSIRRFSLGMTCDDELERLVRLVDEVHDAESHHVIGQAIGRALEQGHAQAAAAGRQQLDPVTLTDFVKAELRRLVRPH